MRPAFGITGGTSSGVRNFGMVSGSSSPSGTATEATGSDTRVPTYNPTAPRAVIRMN